MGREEREYVAKTVFGDEAFREADPKTRLEMGGVRLYQLTGILVDSPAEKIESQAEVVRLTTLRVRGLVNDFVSANPQPAKQEVEHFLRNLE